MPCMRSANFRAYDCVMHCACVRSRLRAQEYPFFLRDYRVEICFVSLYCSHAKGRVHGLLQKSAHKQFMHAPQVSKLVRAARG